MGHSKETSAEIASLAGDLMNIDPAELTMLSTKAATMMASDIRKVAASAVSQRQDDPEAELASQCLEKLKDTTAFGRVIFENLALVATPTERAAYELAEALTKHLTGRE